MNLFLICYYFFKKNSAECKSPMPPHQEILSGEKEIHLQPCRLSMLIPAERQNRAALWTGQGLLAKTMPLNPNIGKETQVHPEASKQGDISSLVLSSLALGVCCLP